MRVLVLGGTWFLGRRIVERLHERGDAVLVVHRGRAEPEQWIPVQHLHTDRHQLAGHAQTITEFAADAVVDSWPLTGADVDAVLAGTARGTHCGAVQPRRLRGLHRPAHRP
jgi:nucleoside-diphosphate-sugar epimerase